MKNIFNQSIKLKKLRLVAILALSAFLLPGFMFFDSNIKWRSGPGGFAGIYLQLGDSLSQNKNLVTSLTESISYKNTGAKLQVSLMGENRGDTFPAMDVLGCSEAILNDYRRKGNPVFAEEMDADCTGASCSHIVSCGGVIVSTGIRLNTDVLEGNISSALLHELGHISGLNHCPPGEKNCTQVPENSIMHPFQNTVASPGVDDVTGLKEQYGALSSEQTAMIAKQEEFKNFADNICNPSPCKLPEEETNPNYRLSQEEKNAIASVLSSIEGDITLYRKEKLFQYYMLRMQGSQDTGVTPEEKLMQNVSEKQQRIAETPTENLVVLRQMLAWQIQERNIVLTELNHEVDKDFLDFTRGEINILIQIRRDMIEEQGRR